MAGEVGDSAFAERCRRIVRMADGRIVDVHVNAHKVAAETLLRELGARGLLDSAGGMRPSRP